MKRITDLEEIIRVLEERGLNPMRVDDAIPLYDARVSCGLPTGVGDARMEFMSSPAMMRAMGSQYCATAMGDSMVDAGIDDGDILWIDCRADIHDGDIVLAMPESGEYLVKIFYTDADEVSWLIPCNDKYKPIPLNEEDSPSIVGKVTGIIKPKPYNMPSRICRKKIEALKQGSSAKLNISEDMVSDAIQVVAPMVTNSRQWYAVYRALIDVDVYERNNYSLFCERVAQEVPDHQFLPKRDELVRMQTRSFKRPLKMWSEDDAPVTGKRFADYLTIGYKVYDILGIR